MRWRKVSHSEGRGTSGVPHQSKLVDLNVERLQLSRADLLGFLGEQFVRLQVHLEPVHLHLPAGVQTVVQLTHAC